MTAAAVPARALYTGARIPAIGFGTFGSDHTSPQEVACAVQGAFEAGYRHFDCAAVYGNEREIGRVFRRIFDSQILDTRVRREEVWVTSKVWNDMHGRVVEACRQSLSDLQLQYLDLYLVHWPFPNWQPPGCDAESRSADARPYIHEEFMKTWRQMESLVDLGLTRHIGTSNMTIPKLRLLLRDARIRPAVNEMEIHPHFQQTELVDFLRANGILPIGYSPLGSPNRPGRDRSPDDTADMDDPVIAQIARRHATHPAAICIKWAVQRGVVPIPMSTKRSNYAANLYAANVAAVCGDPLDADEVSRIAGIDRNCRLIKGQVFLWKAGQSWEDLWDLNGEICPK